MNTRLGLIAIVAMSLAGTALAGPTWQHYGGHKYTLTGIAGTWDAAEAEAKGLGGHLVTINDAAENAWLTSAFLPSSTTPVVQYYIGLSTPTLHPNQTWSWADGSTDTYRNWHPSQPDGVNNGTPVLWAAIMGGGGGYMYGSETLGYWNDASSAFPKYGIIETLCIPVPGAFFLAGLGTAAATWLKRRSLIS